jgi:D-sedoheptulose 7-phosphate isomerase
LSNIFLTFVPYPTMMNVFQEDFRESLQVLQHFMLNTDNFRLMENAGRICVESLRTGGKIISCGNGGSMSDAMHFAEELSGKFREERPSIPALAISDPSYLTCVANDYGYQAVFSRFVLGMGKPGDVLLAISTSGNSDNVVMAALAARENGMKVIALTGKDGGVSGLISDVRNQAPYSQFSDRTQEIHIKVIHSLIHYIEQALA